MLSSSAVAVLAEKHNGLWPRLLNSQLASSHAQLCDHIFNRKEGVDDTKNILLDVSDKLSLVKRLVLKNEKVPNEPNVGDHGSEGNPSRLPTN